jgi:hypothetical protein
MLQLRIPTDVDHPIPCSDCSTPASILLMERTVTRGAVKLKKVGARCFDHMTMAENMLPPVTD